MSVSKVLKDNINKVALTTCNQEIDRFSSNLQRLVDLVAQQEQRLEDKEVELQQHREARFSLDRDVQSESVYLGPRDLGHLNTVSRSRRGATRIYQHQDTVNAMLSDWDSRCQYLERCLC